jgi:ankyrin repeat protein
MLNLLLSHANEEDKKRAFEEYATIDGFSPVFAAVEMDHDLSLQVLIQHGARLDVFTGDDNQIIAGAGPCHLAAFYGRIKCLEVLQKQGIDVIRVKDKAGNTPLHIAVKRGQRAVMQYLLAQAPVDIIHAQNDAGESPIQLASKEIFEEYFVNALIRNIHEYIATSSTLSATKSTSLLTELVRYGHSLGVYNIGNERLDNGWSLLTCCLVSGHISTALELISDGASLDAKDDYGLSPRMWLSFMRALAPSHWCAMVPSQYFYTEGERLIEAITTEYTSLQDKLLLRLDWTGFDTVYLALTNKTGGAAISSSSSSSSSSPPASSARHIDLPPMRIGGGGMEDVIESRMITSIRKQLSPTLLVDVRLRMLAYLFSERERGITDHLSPSAFVLLSTMPYVSPSSLEEYSLYYHRLIERLPRYKEEEEDQQRREVYAHSPTSDDTIRALFSAEHIQWTSWMQPFQGNWTQWSSRKQGVLFILPCSASSKLRDVSSFISEGPALKSYMFPELSTTLRIKCFYKYNMCVLGQKNIRKNYLLTKEAALVQLMNDKSVIIAELEEE